jgi:2'-deoxynucleoside 5'-phosphate N-hydrolase
MTEPIIQKTVYISGALTDMSEDERAKLRAFYDRIGAVCREYGLEPYSPHVYGDPKLVAHLTPKDIDRIDRLAVTQAYLVVAYVGVPSIGVGIEVELAHHADKPVVIMYERKKLDARRITRLVRGNPAVVAEIGFEDFDDALAQLETFLMLFREQITAEKLPTPLTLASHRVEINLVPTPPTDSKPRSWRDR